MAEEKATEKKKDEKPVDPVVAAASAPVVEPAVEPDPPRELTAAEKKYQAQERKRLGLPDDAPLPAGPLAVHVDPPAENLPK
jgi:hypothetical protein